MRRTAIMLAAFFLSLGQAHANAADIVQAAAKTTELKTFSSAVEAAGLKKALSDRGPYTVFAPSDAAFDKLPKSTKDAIMKDKEKLRQVLEHHIIPGKFTVSEVKPGQVNTLDGETIKLTSDNGKVTVNGANVTQSDIMADNGIIHEIDQVVLPGSLNASGE